MERLSITSEIGVLKRVILHTPGAEIEAMTPREAEQDLYNDIIPLQAVLHEYTALKEFLSQVAHVYELSDVLMESLEDTGDKFEFLTDLSRSFPIRSVMNNLMAMPAKELAQAIIQGIPSPKISLSSRLNEHSFISRPLPNTYFMRDSAAVIGNCAISAATAYDVRMVEAIITRFILTHHPDFLARTLLFDGPSERNRYLTAEGGDIMVLSPTVLAIGMSERTTSFAVERIAQNAARASEADVTIFAVDLPKSRATIHLDMTFTMIDRDMALVYEPVILGTQRSRVFRIDAKKGGKLSFHEEHSLLSGLEKIGIQLKPILCGNGHRIYQEREQWWSGANSFAFAPGKILMYASNLYTLEALANAGFSVVPSKDFIVGNDNPANHERLAVTFDGIELARGGGGARCMTFPVEREDL